MLFNSIGFIVFLVIVLGLYYSPLLNWTSKKRVLLFASYLFYALWNPPLILLLWISTFVDWKVGNALFIQADPRKRKLWLLLSLVVNLGFLAFFKYGEFLLENALFLFDAVGFYLNFPAPDILLPMGISFYTFQTMSYTLDMYDKKNRPAKTFLDFALYVSFFPQLVAGPIVRSTELIPQFHEPRKATSRQFLWGLFLLTLGLFQKVVMADTLLSGTADDVFGTPKILNAVDAWSGTLAFSGQIFFDFAGYSTCAIAIALMMGIHLPDNFRYPYGAIGFSDLWRRWHITLSSWLRDYLYFPLGGNRSREGRIYVSLLVTMLLCGLWHGAAWTFVAWGGLHGLFLIAERMLKSTIRINTNGVNGFMMALLTYTLVNVSWVFFRADNFGTARDILASMFFLNPDGVVILPSLDVIKTFAIISMIFLVHWFMRNTSVKALAQKTPCWILSLWWAAMFILIVIAQGAGEQFIYFQF